MRSSIDAGNDGAAPPTICSRYTPSISFLKTGSANLLPVSLDPSERLSSKPILTAAVMPSGP